MRYAFISYQTKDKAIAGQLKMLLSQVGIESFLAHEDIAVSEEWRLKIIEEIGKAQIFICLLSENYIKSVWCVQESGIAAFRNDMIILPLSLDGTVPTGFIGNIQSAKVDPAKILLSDIIPGFLKRDFPIGIELAIAQLGRSNSYRVAEVNFQLILPHVPRMTDNQITTLLEMTAKNGQVYGASRCARDYIPPLLDSHGHFLPGDTLTFLNDACAPWR